MSTQRLTFLYPQLFRTARLSDPAAPIAWTSRSYRNRNPAANTTQAPCQHRSSFATTTAPRESSFSRRHGKAIEPARLRGKDDASSGANQTEKAESKSEKKDEGVDDISTKTAKAQAVFEDTARPAAGSRDIKGSMIKTGLEQAEMETQTHTSLPVPESAAETPTPADSSSHSSSSPSPRSFGTSGPMETILHMDAPASMKQDGSGSLEGGQESSAAGSESSRPPHLTPSPYVHHFDSYSLVKQLEAGGWTGPQAITAMKAIRGLLAANLDVAQAGLVSKADVENETYLFRAACSELSAEVRKNRRAADEAMRQQRTTLQHEVDIVTQRLNQEILTLNDTVRGMFNDRRMAVREEQKAAESAIQQINYKISLLLNSDARSEIEGVRWVLIRRSVLGILFMAVLTLSSLRYASYRSHEKKKEQERLEREQAELLKKEAGKNGGVPPVPDALGVLVGN
ncbi:hypothetical protein VTK73DRAFT_3004 [Phialemonium thermophilum]|uniref:MOZ protein represents a chromatin-associated acetyltransferase n=1 Tax=Phialemonium thermophilum TaxID=223376 RepID=A0ABR3Y2A5_9PEZI